MQNVSLVAITPAKLDLKIGVDSSEIYVGKSKMERLTMTPLRRIRQEFIGAHVILLAKVFLVRLLFLSAKLDKVLGNKANLFFISRGLDMLESHKGGIDTIRRKLIDERNCLVHVL